MQLMVTPSIQDANAVDLKCLAGARHSKRTKRVVLSAVIVSTIFAALVFCAFGTHAANPLIVAYYGGWATYSGREIAHIDGDRLTHLIYAFANIGPDLTVSIGDIAIDVNKRFPGDDPTQLIKGNFNQLRKLKQRHPHLKILIAIGGWSWSGRFSDAALTEESRERFAQSVVRFITTFGFDGVDIDWEYPVSGGLPTNVRRPEDRRNFTLLMQTLRKHLDAQGEIDGKHYLLTFAAAASAGYTNNIELPALLQVVDFINLMTYDLHGPWDSLTGFVAPLYPDPESRFTWTWSVDDAVQHYLNLGVPKHQLVIGVPFYGYRYDGVRSTSGQDDHEHGLYRPFSSGTSVSYRDIAGTDWMVQGEYARHPVSRVPYRFDGETMISFEDPVSIAEKGRYIKEHGLAGAMIWDISQDTLDHALLTSLYEALGKSRAAVGSD